MRSRLLRPSWLVLHVLVVLLMAVMVRLGIWQSGRGEATGSLRNYSYGLEWYAFVVLTAIGWVMFCLDETSEAAERERHAPPEPAAAPPVPVPTAVHDDDPELTAWNARLAELARKDAEASS